VLWEQIGLMRAARAHEVVLTFTDRLPLASGGRFVVWLFELPTHRLRENRRKGVGGYQRASDLVTRALWKRSLRRAALVLAGSDATAAELRGALPGLRRVRVVRPGLDSRFSPGEPAGGGDRFVLHLGSDDPRDNTAVVVDAFRRVREAVSEPIRLVVTGGDSGPQNPGVEWAGRVSDDELVRLYRRGIVVVDAYLQEWLELRPT